MVNKNRCSHRATQLRCNSVANWSELVSRSNAWRISYLRDVNDGQNCLEFCSQAVKCQWIGMPLLRTVRLLYLRESAVMMRLAIDILRVSRETTPVGPGLARILRIGPSSA